MKDDFNVEQFVVECRRRVPLDNLRDDLAVYLKILQSAMIELINKDYADFVNLSTNLVGLDKAINNLMFPLNQLKNEVLSIRDSLDDATLAIEEKMQKKCQIRDQKACLQRLMNILHCVDKMEHLLGIGEEGSRQMPHSRDLEGQLIERVATEFNKLQFYVNKSRGLPLVEDIKPRIATITTTLQFSLEGSFREGLQTGNVDVLRQCLRTYATIDKMRDAENLFRIFTVKPYMEDVINERFVANHPQGLKGMLSTVLEFIPKHCKKLQDVTSGSGQAGTEFVRGYDFLVNSVWPEITSNVEAKVSSIFAPGNPNVFHEKYQMSMDFVDKFERQCASQASVKRLRAHPSYNTFMSKWSLPVYFQIRFQEIAGAFETSLNSPFGPASDKTLFHLNASFTLWNSMHRCWEAEIFLQPLCHRFWKLNLQLMARYVSWMDEVYDTEMSSRSKPETRMPRTASMPALSAAEHTESLQRKETMAVISASPTLSMGELVCLIADAQMLVAMLPDFYNESIKACLSQLGVQHFSLIEESLQDSYSAITDQLPKFSKIVTDDITEQCAVHIKAVNDLPRLYRRTNREVPSKASSYVNTMMKPLQQFNMEHGSVIGEDNWQQWVEVILGSLAEQYLSITNDVLTSVKKMEESLKRLKRGKGAGSSAGSQGMTDDDKIRLQLFLDVKDLGQQITTLGLDPESIETYKTLHKLVEGAKNGSNTS